MTTKIIDVPEELAAAVLCICGVYGNGEDRKKALKEDGLDPEKVQRIVNAIMEVMP